MPNKNYRTPRLLGVPSLDTCRAPGPFARQEEKDTSASEKAEQKKSVPEFFLSLMVDLLELFRMIGENRS